MVGLRILWTIYTKNDATSLHRLAPLSYHRTCTWGDLRLRCWWRMAALGHVTQQLREQDPGRVGVVPRNDQFRQLISRVPDQTHPKICFYCWEWKEHALFAQAVSAPNQPKEKKKSEEHGSAAAHITKTPNFIFSLHHQQNTQNKQPQSQLDRTNNTWNLK